MQYRAEDAECFKIEDRVLWAVFWYDGDEQGDALPTENPNLLQVPKRRRTIRAS